jgi:hypothetical protein
MEAIALLLHRRMALPRPLTVPLPLQHLLMVPLPLHTVLLMARCLREAMVCHLPAMLPLLPLHTVLLMERCPREVMVCHLEAMLPLLLHLPILKVLQWLVDTNLEATVVKQKYFSNIFLKDTLLKNSSRFIPTEMQFNHQLVYFKSLSIMYNLCNPGYHFASFIMCLLYPIVSLIYSIIFFRPF